MKLKYSIIVFGIFILIGFGVSSALNRTQQAGLVQSAVIYPVSLLKDKAVPDFVTIHTGEYVQFNSKDGKEHEMAHGRGDGYGDIHNHESGGESPVIHADEGYRVQFKKVGTYEFHDHDNPKLYVTVLVYKDSEKR